MCATSAVWKPTIRPGGVESLEAARNRAHEPTCTHCRATGGGGRILNHGEGRTKSI